MLDKPTLSSTPEPEPLRVAVVGCGNIGSQHAAALASKGAFQRELSAAGFGGITTEVLPAGDFFYAEDYHQQYLAVNPRGYCGLGGTGVSCPVGLPAR